MWYFCKDGQISKELLVFFPINFFSWGLRACQLYEPSFLYVVINQVPTSAWPSWQIKGDAMNLTLMYNNQLLTFYPVTLVKIELQKCRNSWNFTFWYILCKVFENSTWGALQPQMLVLNSLHHPLYISDKFIESSFKF